MIRTGRAIAVLPFSFSFPFSANIEIGDIEEIRPGVLKLRSLHMTTTITTESEEPLHYDCPSKIQAVCCKIGCVRLTHKIFVFDNV